MELNYHPSEIQANILKGHGRDHACFLFFKLDTGLDEKFLRKEIARFSKEEITSHEKQCEDTSKKHLNKHEFVVVFYLSHKGFNALKVDKGFIPSDPAFRDGMNCLRRMDELGDYFDGDSQQKITGADVMVMIANSNLEMLKAGVERLKAEFIKNIAAQKTCFSQFAQTLRDGNGRPKEHFGYTDGFSTSRDESELAGMGLVKEQGGDRYGSYVAFRKIQQNIQHFERMVKDLSASLGKPREYAMALLMGRFPKGTPITLSNVELSEEEWKDIPFDYKGDDGSRCPVHAHIRVVNPRKGEASKPRIIRRSMTYVDPDGKHGKGLCFLSYQRSLVEDFVPLFQRIKSDPKDVLVYRTRDLIWEYKCEDERGRKFCVPYAKGYSSWVQGAVYQLIGGRELTTFLGGQYFYAPSIPFLRDLEKLGAPE